MEKAHSSSVKHRCLIAASFNTFIQHDLENLVFFEESETNNCS